MHKFKVNVVIIGKQNKTTESSDHNIFYLHSKPLTIQVNLIYTNNGSIQC